MRLERHVGGLSQARKVDYLEHTGWVEDGGQWQNALLSSELLSVSKALHHQLTADLSRGLARFGWKVEGFSPRGYAQLVDPLDLSTCSLPAALRRQARRQKCPVRELTYGLFLNAMTSDLP